MKKTLFRKCAVAGAVSIIVCASLVASYARAQTTVPQGGFLVTQKVRNLTKQNFAWTDSAQAEPGDRLEFQATVLWKESQSTNNVLVRETLADGMVYAGNLKLDGNSIAGNISSENVDIGVFVLNQAKIVTFEVNVADAATIPAGVSDFVNTVTVFNTQGGASTATSVQVTGGSFATPTDVSTGPISMWMLAVAGLFGFLFLGTYIFFVKYYITHEVLASGYDNRTDRKLAAMVGKIKKEEG